MNNPRPATNKAISSLREQIACLEKAIVATQNLIKEKERTIKSLEDTL